MIDMQLVKSFEHDINFALNGESKHHVKTIQHQDRTSYEKFADSFLHLAHKMIPLVELDAANGKCLRIKHGFHDINPIEEFKQLAQYIGNKWERKREIHLYQVLTCLLSKFWIITLTLMTLMELWQAFHIFQTKAKFKGESLEMDKDHNKICAFNFTCNPNCPSWNRTTSFRKLDLRPFILHHIGFRFSPLNKMMPIFFCSSLYVEIPLLLGYTFSLHKQQAFSFKLNQIFNRKDLFLIDLREEASKFLRAVDEMRLSIQNALILHSKQSEPWPSKPQLCDECSTLLYNRLIDFRPRVCDHQHGIVPSCSIRSMTRKYIREKSIFDQLAVLDECHITNHHSAYCHLMEYVEPMPTKESQRKMFSEMRVIIMAIVICAGLPTLITANWFIISDEMELLFEAGTFLYKCRSLIPASKLPVSISHLFVNEGEKVKLIQLVESFQPSEPTNGPLLAYNQLSLYEKFLLLGYFSQTYFSPQTVSICFIINTMHIYSLIWFSYGWCHISDGYLLIWSWSSNLEKKLHHCTGALRNMHHISENVQSERLNIKIEACEPKRAYVCLEEDIIWREKSEANNNSISTSESYSNLFEIGYAKLESAILLACCEFDLYREAQSYYRGFYEYFSVVCYSGVAIMIILIRTIYVDELFHEGIVTIPFMILLMFSAEIFLIVSISKTNCYKRVNAALNNVLANLSTTQVDNQRHVVRMLRKHILNDRQIDVMQPVRLLGLPLVRSTFISFNYYIAGGLLYYIMQR